MAMRLPQTQKQSALPCGMPNSMGSPSRSCQSASYILANSDSYLTPRRSLLIMDWEGAEFSLLYPQTDPVLLSVDMIVEIHREAGSSEEMWRRFEKKHRCERLDYIPRQGVADERRGEQEWLVLTAFTTVGR
jgi:hypothetical protein